MRIKFPNWIHWGLYIGIGRFKVFPDPTMGMRHDIRILLLRPYFALNSSNDLLTRLSIQGYRIPTEPKTERGSSRWAVSRRAYF